jgi:hypothetical protein
MSNLSKEEIDREVEEIIRKFDLYECAKCAEAILEWAETQGIEKTLIRLKTRYRDEDFIVSDRMAKIGVLDSITKNGIHYGVRIQGQVFDNLSTGGMPLPDWIEDFHCPSEAFILEELDGFSK